MIKFGPDRLREIMSNPKNIRNISVIGHIGHGKSSLTKPLVAKAEIAPIKDSENNLFTDDPHYELDRAITTKSTGVSLGFRLHDQDHILNLMDTPGHADFSAEVTAALRITDGALVVVDCVEGVCAQTETFLGQAMQEMIAPALVINKIDHAIFELKLDSEAIYKNFVRVIDRSNVVIDIHAQPDMGSIELNPIKGNVAFGCGRDGWGFTLSQFARIYAKKFSILEHKMMQRLWGENYFDSQAKMWRSSNTGMEGQVLTRSFCQFVVDPILKVSKACLEMNQDTIDKLLTIIDVKLTPEEKELRDKKLFRVILHKWMNAADALLEMMVTHLPSPKKAQEYRAKYLYEGPKNDPFCISMSNCDSEGPLMVYVSKMVPMAEKHRFYAFGRVFSGKISTGQTVWVVDPDKQPGSNAYSFQIPIKSVVIMMGRNAESVKEVPAGNMVALVGLAQFLGKTGTIVSDKAACKIRAMKYPVSPVVRVSVKGKWISGHCDLMADMQNLSKSDPLVKCYTDEETGEKVVCGAGELHMQVLLKDLGQKYTDLHLLNSDPMVVYFETVSRPSIKESSKLGIGDNGLFFTAEPISEEFVEALENGEINFRDQKAKQKALTEKFGWEKNEVATILAFGPDGEGPSILVDAIPDCPFMCDIKEQIIAGFNAVTRAGVLCSEPMRGVRFNLTETFLYYDSAYWGGGKIASCARRMLYASQLMAGPTLQEPIFRVSITAPLEATEVIYTGLIERRGTVEQELEIEDTPLVTIKGFIPVSESFGFASQLRELTNGKAVPNCVFDHWQTLDGDCSKPDSKLTKLIQSIRVRRGLREKIPMVIEYDQKL